MTVGTLTRRVTVDEPIDEFDLDVQISVLPDLGTPTAGDTHWQSCLGSCGITCGCTGGTDQICC